MMFTPTGDYVQRFQEIVDDLADEIGRSAVISDASMRPIVATVQNVGVDEARILSILERRPPEGALEYVRGLGVLESRVPVEVPASDAHGFLRRLCVPFWMDDTCLGFLWLIVDKTDLTDTEISTITRAEAAFFEAYVEGAARSDEPLGHLQDWIIGGLLDDDDQRRSRTARLFESSIASRKLHGLHVGVLLGKNEPHDVATLRAVLQERSSHRVLMRSLNARRTVMLFQITGDADRIASALTPDQAMGLSAVVDLGRVRTAYAEAGFAALVAKVDPKWSRARYFSDLGAWHLLRHVPWDEAGVRSLSQDVGLLLASGAESLRETVETMLDAGGDVARTVSELHVHRATFYYRMGRVRDLLGPIIDDGWSRVGLHAALRLDRLIAAHEEIENHEA